MDITKDEELQAKEFLKRAEVRTMRKDLQKMREVDALKERDKIIKGKTTEELQRELANKKRGQERMTLEEQRREKVLSKNIEEERLAEKQIKDYAEESEKQQIFILESQRLGLEKQIDIFEQEKESSLALEKNQILIDKKTKEAKFNSIVEEEQKIEKEEKFIAEQEKTSNVPSERKSLEERRSELEAKRQEIEKKRWSVEKEIIKLENEIEKIDTDYLQITKEKISLKEKIKAIDISLREIYSKIIKRVEDKKRGLLEEQQAKVEKREQILSQKKEEIQREQWSGTTEVPKEKEFLKGAPNIIKERLTQSAEKEEEQRRHFMEDIEKQTIEEQGKKDNNKIQ